MIADLEPYPAMKESRVPWLGHVPEHWDVAATRHRYSQHLGKMLDTKRIIGGHLVRYLRNVDVQWDRINTADLPSMDIAPGEHDRYTLRPGDLLVCEGGEVGRCATWPGELAVCGFQKALHRLRPISGRDLPRFLYYALRVAAHSGAFDDGHESTIPHLTGDKLRAHRFPFPSLHEQVAIVRFLDHADRRIRRYIRIKQKLIKLLEEQKRAIIHRAVTRGLDPNVRLKPSGVEWLGSVPEHWDVRSFTRCAIERADYRGATPTKTESGVFLVTARNVRKGRIDYEVSQEFVAEAEYATIMRRGLPRLGDLLLTMEAPLGNAALVDREDVAFAQRVVRFRFAPSEFAPEFVLHAVLSPYFQNQLLRRGTGSTALGIKASKLPQLQLLCPPLLEQVAILERIREECCPIEFAADRAQREISLLREFRSRLIADVVTGKLDVREAAARLPDETDEPEPLDEGEAEEIAEGVGEEDLEAVVEEPEA